MMKHYIIIIIIMQSLSISPASIKSKNPTHLLGGPSLLFLFSNLASSFHARRSTQPTSPHTQCVESKLSSTSSITNQDLGLFSRMGNVNGREDVEGGDSSSGVDGSDGPPDDMVADGELMVGQSPPSSPRAAHSPLMFTPQVPVVPLQRPDEAHIQTHTWSGSEFDDVVSDQGIPTMITWIYDGQDVSVEGSWDNWKTRKLLHRSGKDFTVMNVLPSGVYHYRFIVDGQWRYSSDKPWAQDENGLAYNILDLQDYVPEDVESIAGFQLPQSPDSSYSNMQLVSDDFAKEPPLVPPHLQMTLLNAPTSNHLEILPPFSRPQHVVLNHLYMQKGKSGSPVVALGSTNRFLAKYVTVVLYKSIQR